MQAVALNRLLRPGSHHHEPAALRRHGWTSLSTCLQALALIFLAFISLRATAQTTSPTYRITAASYVETNNILNRAVPAGANGANLQLTGTLPSAAQQAQTPLLACFYTGYGSTAGIPLALPNGTNQEPLTVPASTITAVPIANFTATNSYTVSARVYFIRSTGVCDGTFDATLTNQLTVPITAPSLLPYSGPTSIPQTNSATSIQAPPSTLSLPALSYLSDSATNGSVSSVTFGSFGTVTATLLRQVSLSVPVPPAFAASPAGTTAALSLCFTASPATNYTVCTTPNPAITLTVAALSASTGTITATPSPVLTTGQNTLAAQFTKTSTPNQPAAPGAPSGVVSFIADGKTLPPAKLVLDSTATFATQTSSVTAPLAPTPIITPAAGSYTTAQTIVITDSNSAAAIYYTQDGSTPTSASTRYTAPFSISTSQTINAIAVVAGTLNSAVASSTYTVTLAPPTQLIYSVQPVNTALNSPVTPAVQVALEDANGNIVTSATNAVTLVLRSNPGQSTLSGTTTVNAVNGIATFSDLSLNNIANGYTLYATSGTLAPALSNTFNITPPQITMTVQSALVGINSTLNGTVSVPQVSQTGGVTISLSSSTPANVTISPASVNIAQGQNSAAFTYTGVAAGSSTLSGSATNYQTGTVQATGTAAQVSLGTIPPVAPGQSVSLALSLATAAPAGGTTVTFVSSNPNVATITSSVFVPAGQRTAATNPQVTGVIIGTTTITATAPGYAPSNLPVNVTVVATVNPSTTYINLTTSTNTKLTISAPAQTGGLTFQLKSDDPTIATVPATVTVIQGSTSVNIPITGVKTGSTTIRADYPGVTEATGTVNVNSGINGGNVLTGYDFESSVGPSFNVSPPNPVNVTITSNNPAIATISSTSTAVGQTTLTFNNITSSYIGTVYVQGQSVGSTTLTITAPGYDTGTTTITVDPSGFAYYGVPNFSTTSFSSANSLGIYPVTLTPSNLQIASFGGYSINPGSAAINVPLTSSDTTVGTVISPVIFHAGDTYQTGSFQPVGPGTTNINIGQAPGGFTLASQYEQITATVTAPAVSPGDVLTAINMQSSVGIGLPVAPPTPVTVTVTSNGPTIATISSSGTVVGGTTLTFPNVTSTYVGTIYVQGQTQGTTTYTVSAPGYTSGSGKITTDLSGFVYYGNPSFSTTTLSTPNSVYVYTAAINPQSLNVDNFFLQVSPGVAPISVPVVSSDTSIGTITTSPLVFNPGDNGQSTTFQPGKAGTTNLTITNPTGYTTSAQYQQITATVTAPAISESDVTTGTSLQYPLAIYLPVTPPTPVTVTVATSAATTASISNSSSTAGTSTLTFNNVSSGYVGTIFVQGQSTGTANLTVSAPGYTAGTSKLTVDPSGFSYYGVPNISTTTFSSPSTITVYTTVLNPSDLSIQNFGLGLNPGVGPVAVPIIDSTPSVGTLASSALAFNTYEGYEQTTFTPVSAGTATITLGTPVGFRTPSQYQQITATVSAPAIGVSDVTTGLNLETNLGIYLPVAPPNPVTVTVTSNGPLISTISSNATIVGTNTIVFTNVTSTSVGTIYVQGAGIGATTLTVSAPGYTNGTSNITINPSGFTYYGVPNFTTTASSGPTTLTVYPTVLNPGTLTAQIIGHQVSPAAGNVNVPVTSSNTSVGTITTSPLVFTPGSSYVQTTFQPLATGSSTITIGTPTGFSTPSQYTQITGTVQ
jgi:hypothetical protein